APRTARRTATDVAPELDATGTEVFERLRRWRAETAREQGVPAYVVFHDATLRGIAESRPTTLTELSAVSGVGAAKLDRYGPQVLVVVGADGPPLPDDRLPDDPLPDDRLPDDPPPDDPDRW